MTQKVDLQKHLTCNRAGPITTRHLPRGDVEAVSTGLESHRVVVTVEVDISTDDEEDGDIADNVAQGSNPTIIVSIQIVASVLDGYEPKPKVLQGNSLNSVVLGDPAPEARVAIELNILRCVHPEPNGKHHTCESPNEAQYKFWHYGRKVYLEDEDSSGMDGNDQSAAVRVEIGEGY